MTAWGESTVHAVVVDDLELFRRRVVVALEEGADLDVVGAAATVPEARRLGQELPADVVFVGLSALAAEGDVAAGVAALRQALPGARIVVLSAPDDEVAVRDALAAGAHAEVPRDRAVTDAAAVARRVALGEACLAPVQAQHALDALGAPGRPWRPTDRERRVLGLLAAPVDPAAVAEGTGLGSSAVGIETADALARLASSP